MIKIVQITTDSREHFKDYSNSSPYFGTAPQSLLAGLSGMPDVEIHVVCCVRKPVSSPEQIAPNIFYHSLEVPIAGWGRSLFLGCVHAIRKLLREIEPDIVHGQGTERECAMAAVLSGYPNLITIHGNMRAMAKRQELRGKLFYKMASALEAFCLWRTDGVVAISSYTQRLVEDLARQVWLIPNAVDSRFFEISLNPPAIPRILFVGAIHPHKNPLGLLEAASGLLRQGKCTVALAGQMVPESGYGKQVLALADSLPGVSFLGFLNREVLMDEFAKSSLLVLPTFEDNCPMVVLEALAAGVAVAASRVGGVPDLIDHGRTGLLFDPGDPSDVTMCIERLIEDPSMRQTLASQGRIDAMERFHPKAIATKHLEVYQEVLAGN